jgi:hypothetical protein
VVGDRFGASAWDRFFFGVSADCFCGVSDDRVPAVGVAAGDDCGTAAATTAFASRSVVPATWLTAASVVVATSAIRAIAGVVAGDVARSRTM